MRFFHIQVGIDYGGLSRETVDNLFNQMMDIGSVEKGSENEWMECAENGGKLLIVDRDDKAYRVGLLCAMTVFAG